MRSGSQLAGGQAEVGSGSEVTLPSPPPPQAITGYRETERWRWGGAGRAVLGRVAAAAFPPRRPPLPLVHVLDLHPRGHVRPHVDSVKVGEGVAGGAGGEETPGGERASLWGGGQSLVWDGGGVLGWGGNLWG